jgi:hypothetical protein
LLSLHETGQDFIERSAPIGELLKHMQRVFTPFVRHHTTMKWQAWDWARIKDKFPHDTWVCVQDFSENLKLEVKLENQSKYYVTKSVTLYLVWYRWEFSH